MAEAGASEGVPEPWQLYRHLWAALILGEELPPGFSATAIKPSGDGSLAGVASLARGSSGSGGGGGGRGRKRGRDSGRGSSGRRSLHEGNQQQQQDQEEDEVFGMVSNAVYDALMSCSLDALRQLDLSYHLAPAAAAGGVRALGTQAATAGTTAAAVGATAPAVGDGGDAGSAAAGADTVEAAAELGGLVAGNLGDMQAFIRLSAFLCEVLPSYGAQPFSGWGFILTLEVVGGSNIRPLVSGYYHLATAAVKLCKAAGLLGSPWVSSTAAAPAAGSGRAAISSKEPQQQQHVNEPPAAASALCIQVYQEYLAGVLAACQRYKDELLAACLELLLTAPPVLLRARQLGRPVALALQLGLQHPGVAEVVVGALETWEEEQLQELQELLPKVRDEGDCG